MDPSELYEQDFVAWTEHQATALRRAAGSFNVLDWPNLAEEIESLGRRDVREVESLIRRIFLHLLKIAADPSSFLSAHWMTEVATFQADAAAAFAPSMAQKVDVGRLWMQSLRLAANKAGSEGGSPVTLGELVSDDFAVVPALEEVSARIKAHML